jgi:hypothetical protein
VPRDYGGDFGHTDSTEGPGVLKVSGPGAGVGGCLVRTELTACRSKLLFQGSGRRGEGEGVQGRAGEVEWKPLCQAVLGNSLPQSLPFCFGCQVSVED